MAGDRVRRKRGAGRWSTRFLKALRHPWLAGIIADDPADIEIADSWPAPDGFIDPTRDTARSSPRMQFAASPQAQKVSVEQVIDRRES
jgi:hypothetical protein